MMKRSKIYLFLLMISSLAVIYSCEKEERGPVVRPSGAPVITSPAAGSSYTLTDSTENEVMATFTWEPADFGFQAAVTYTLEIDLAGDNFANAAILGVTNDLTLDVLEGKVNNALLTLNAFPGEVAQAEVRVTAAVSKEVDTLFSDPLSLSITPFEKVIEYPKLYVPGSYQAAWNATWNDWDPSNESTVIYSVKDNGVYEGYLWFSNDTTELKFTKVPAWEQDNTIGDPDPTGLSGTLQIGNWGGNNIRIPGGPGYFLVVADLNDAKYTYTKTDWGVIGDATAGGWDSDQNMTYDKENNVWTITLDLTAGAFKFRANDDWTLNYGDTGGDRRLERDGDNIPVAEAGNYTIILDLSGPIYTYKITKN